MKKLKFICELRMLFYSVACVLSFTYASRLEMLSTCRASRWRFAGSVCGYFFFHVFLTQAKSVSGDMRWGMGGGQINQEDRD